MSEEAAKKSASGGKHKSGYPKNGSKAGYGKSSSKGGYPKGKGGQGRKFGSGKSGDRKGGKSFDGEKGGYKKRGFDKTSSSQGKGQDSKRGGKKFDKNFDSRKSRDKFEANGKAESRTDDRSQGDFKKRDFDKKGVKKDGFKKFDSSKSEKGGKTGKGKSSDAKKRQYRSKKAFDQQKVSALMGADEKTYRGELDPKKDTRSKIAPGRKTREMRKAARELDAQQAEELRLEREKLDDETLPVEKRFYKNEASPARLAALDVTRAVRKRNAYARDLIEARIDNSNMSEADRSFATLLVLGVVSTYGTLDELINRGMKKPTDAFDDVRDALRISTYELIFLGKSPHAAIDQGVELVRAVSPSASGLGNAILHRVSEMRDSFPFGDPNTDLDALARVYAFPKWMARKLIEDLGAKEAAALMHASNEPAPLFVAVNSLKATDEEVAGVFEAAGATLRPAESQGVTPDGCFHVSNPRAIADKGVLELLSEGKILVADASAQAVAASIYDGFEPESVLEIGAGRGTKTILLQSNANRKIGHQIKLTSLDMHEFKMRLLSERAAEFDVQLEEAVVGNGMRLDASLGDKKYSTVFIDAPCSGLGTLRRHPEIRWRINSKHISELADTGLAMLRSAAAHVEDGGQLVYATCTVTYDENSGVVKRFLEETPEGKYFRLAPIFDKPAFSSQLTDGSADAHFAARFVKIG